MSHWHQLDADTLARRLDTDSARGLSEDEARRRLDESGPNELIESGGRGPWRILAEQLTGAMVVVLFVAALISALLKEYTDAWVILAIIVLNAALGFVQDYRAERAMAALKKLAVPRVRVRRDGAVREVSARELVPGDAVLLEVGNLVPADCRLIEGANLKIQESALTGESDPVAKRRRAARRGRAAARRPHEHGLHGDRRDLRPGPRAGDDDRDGDGARPDRRLAPVGRGGADPAAEAARPARPLAGDGGAGDRRGGLRPGPAAGRGPPGHAADLAEPRRRRHPRGPARRGDGRPGARRPADVPPPRPDPQAAGGRDARLGHGHLLRQDRHPDREPDDRDRPGRRRRPRRAPRRGQRGRRARGARGPRRRSPGAGPAADRRGPLQRRRSGARRRSRRSRRPPAPSAIRPRAPSSSPPPARGCGATGSRPDCRGSTRSRSTRNGSG